MRISQQNRTDILLAISVLQHRLGLLLADVARDADATDIQSKATDVEHWARSIHIETKLAGVTF